MTASRLPGAPETLALVTQLRDIVRDFAAREEQLARAHRIQLGNLQRQREDTAGQGQARLAEQRDRLLTGFAMRAQRLQDHHRLRMERLHRAHRNAHTHGLERANELEGRARFKWQRGHLEANRQREADQKAVEDAFAAFHAQLEEEREHLHTLDQAARQTLGGYGTLIRLLNSPAPPRSSGSGSAPQPSPHANPGRQPEGVVTGTAPAHESTLEELRLALDSAAIHHRSIRRRVLPVLFATVPPWLWVFILAVLVLGAVPLLPHAGIPGFTWTAAAITVGAMAVLMFLLYLLGRRAATELAQRLGAEFARAQSLHTLAADQGAAHRADALQRAQAAFEEATRQLDAEWNSAQNQARNERGTITVRLGQKAKRLMERAEQANHGRMAALQQRQTTEVRQLDEGAAGVIHRASQQTSDAEQALQAAHQEKLATLGAEWRATVEPICRLLQAAAAKAERLFPPWSESLIQEWTPAQEFAHAAPFAKLEVAIEQLAGGLPQSEPLALPGPAQFTVPLLVTMPEQGSVLFETRGAGRDEAIAALNNLVQRLLSVAPPGKLNFTLLDPAELGQSFAGLMHLADHEDRLINSRIWTQTAQIEEQLGLLNEHIEKVAQMYLRNEYQTITEYNRQAGRIAEKYHFLVIADFPVNFSEVAVRRLQSIAASGARCGVYLLMHWDQRRQAPAEFVPDELRRHCICLRRHGAEFILGAEPLEGASLKLEVPPAPELTTAFLNKVGHASMDSNRVEVPFDDVAPPDNQLWSLETTGELRVPIGRTGATKLQYLSLGKGTQQHALVAGKTGSGKSTLFHVIITNLALWCSPEQVEFYLVDFKKGVEFKCYGTHRLPHARVVAIESDREFGLSVLERLDEELKRRGEMFRKLGVQDVAGYKRAGGTEPLPRTLLLIDEFQELFVEDDRVAQNAALLLDRIVRQGRAFGIHVVLGSQTLGGAYTLARTTLGQMVVRIALQCNEADAYLIMDDTNPAPRLLSRPGEAIYNDSAGAIAGNSPFQIVWMTDQERDGWLEKVATHASREGKPWSAPIVFEGNAPADVRENVLLERLLQSGAAQPAGITRIWLGAPNSIKGPTEVAFRRLSGNNLLVVGQREETALSLLGLGLMALSAQHPKGTARFMVFEALAPDTPQQRFLDRVTAAAPHELTRVRGAEMDAAMTTLDAELKRRLEAPPGEVLPTIYVMIHELQKFKKLRFEEDFGFTTGESTPAVNPGQALNALITEGPAHGIHVLCTCDTYNNVTRFLSRKAISEFEMRVLFQMSANDSASLIDSPKAGDLGLHRALLHNGQEGFLETFRPYAMPDAAWLEAAAQRLCRA